MKRKLLLEGSGGGDEKKIHGLVKIFAEWCMADVTPEKRCLRLQKIQFHYN